LADGFDLRKISDEEEAPFKETHTTLTLWIPKIHKAKFDQIQRKSKAKFGKVLKEMICAEIERKSVEK
jgi:hypothetical protein